MKVKAIANVVASVNGGSVRLVVGQEYDMPPDDADHLIRGKYVESAEIAEIVVPVEETPKRKKAAL